MVLMIKRSMSGRPPVPLETRMKVQQMLTLNWAPKDIADECGVGTGYVYEVRRTMLATDFLADNTNDKDNNNE